jgi:hypothetical protein
MMMRWPEGERRHQAEAGIKLYHPQHLPQEGYFCATHTPLVSPDEVRKIMGVLNVTADKPGFYNRRLQLLTLKRCVAWMLKQQPPKPTHWGMEGPCPFYSRKECLIYSFRPIACRILATRNPEGMPWPAMLRMSLAAGFAAWYAKHLHVRLRQVPKLSPEHFTLVK